jgi:hypothetical protein
MTPSDGPIHPRQVRGLNCGCDLSISKTNLVGVSWVTTIVAIAASWIRNDIAVLLQLFYNIQTRVNFTITPQVLTKGKMNYQILYIIDPVNFGKTIIIIESYGK